MSIASGDEFGPFPGQDNPGHLRPPNVLTAKDARASSNPAPRRPVAEGAGGPRGSRGLREETRSKAANPLPAPFANRVIAIHFGNEDRIVGAGFRVDNEHVLTSSRVVALALASELREGSFVRVCLPDLANSPRPDARVRTVGFGSAPEDDVAVLVIQEPSAFPAVARAEFATALKFKDKTFSIINFSGGIPEGVVADGVVIQDSSNGPVGVSLALDPRDLVAGSPVWSPDLQAFVGIMAMKPDYFLPSGILARFFPELPVKFRIPPSDKPVIGNVRVDDPNVQLFPGTSSENGKRRLTATIQKRPDGYSTVVLRYEILPNSPPTKGRFVTFITYPDMAEYELFAEVNPAGVAEVKCTPFYPDFTVAAIGDAGETRLTLDLEKPMPRQPTTPYRQGASGYTSEFMAVGGGRAVEDQLKVKDYAERLAELIALRETKLPVAVGLFGNWGSGKSHFMNLLNQHMLACAKRAREDWEKRTAAGEPVDSAPKGQWCHQIVPVYFNAWHYVDTNLWASLVAHIFESLFAHLKPKEDELKKVQQLLEQASGTAARARKNSRLRKRKRRRRRWSWRQRKQRASSGRHLCADCSTVSRNCFRTYETRRCARRQLSSSGLSNRSRSSMNCRR